MDTTLPLVEIIREKIRSNGPVTFSWFMEQALYHPEFGYYTAPRQRIGRAGDFYTNVSVGPVLGDMLASQLLKMWEKLGRTEEFTIAEQGAEDGQLALDILSAIQSREGELPGHLHYVIVEPHTEKQRQQRARLEPDFVENITWAAELSLIHI